MTATISRPDGVDAAATVSFSITEIACGPCSTRPRVQEVAGEHAEDAVAELLVVQVEAFGRIVEQLRRARRRSTTSRGASSSCGPSGTCTYARPTSSYACRLWGESSSDTTWVKPLTLSQISSSWRRTLRWLRANPPGPLAGAEAVLDHPREVARLQALGPAPAQPAGGHAAIPSGVARSIVVEQLDRASRSGDVVHAHRRAAPCSKHQTVVGERRVVATRRFGRRPERSAPRNDLRDVPTRSGTPDASRDLGQRARATRRSAPRSWRSRFPGRRGPRGASIPAAIARLDAHVEARRRPRGRRRRSSRRCCIVRGVPRMCIATYAAPARATTAEHRGIGGAARNVVHHRPRPLASAASRHRRLGRVDAHRRPVPAPRAPRTTGSDAAQLLVVVDGLRARAGSTRRRRRSPPRRRLPAASPCATAASASR